MVSMDIQKLQKYLLTCVVAAVLVSVGIGIGYHLGQNQQLLTHKEDYKDPEIKLEQRQKRSIKDKLNPASLNKRSERNAEKYCQVACCSNQSAITGSQKTPFDQLNIKEMDAIFDAMKKTSFYTLVNTNRGEQPSASKSNYVTHMVPLIEKKEDVVNYLNTGRNFPQRYAEVQVTRPNAAPPDVMYYKVGPLNNLNIPLRVEPLTKPGELHYNTHVGCKVEYAGAVPLLQKELGKLKPLLEESFDGANFDEGLDLYNAAPAGLQPEDRTMAYGIGLIIGGLSGCCWDSLIHKMPLDFEINHRDPNPDKWKIQSLFYLNQGPFANVEELLTAYQNNEIDKFHLPKGYRQILFNKTLGRQRDSGSRAYSHLPPPTTYEPAGPRYRINGQVVYWMGWEFTVTNNMMHGPAIYNIKFQGETIIFENSLSDASIIYSGTSRYTSNAAFFDSNFGLGELQDLIPGVDCPTYAKYMDTYYWDYGKQRPEKTKGMCVFEADGQEPLWRRNGGYKGGMNNNYLVIRYIPTVSNYDYIVEYLFFLDGAIQNKIKSTGYIASDWWNEDSKYVTKCDKKHMFGYRVSEYQYGPIHDHTFAFKVDFDLLGVENSFETIDWKAGDSVEALKLHNPRVTTKPPYIYFNQTRYLQFNNIYEEAGFRISLEQPKFYVVYSEDERNQWGVKRGYRIAHHATGAQVLPDSHPNLNGQSFTKNHIWVTRFHDEERYVTGSNDNFRVADPLFSLEKTVDRESINNKDLVTWVAFTFLHIPTSENYPLTVREEAGFSLKPFNFFSETKALDLPQYIDHKYENGTVGLQERPPSVGGCTLN